MREACVLTRDPETKTKGTPRRVYLTLDALRGIAALLVVFWHSSAVFAISPVGRGYLAVDLFFVMSGVVIEHAYGGQLATGTNVRGFMAQRVARLYPAYILGTAASFVLILTAIALGYPTEWTVSSLLAIMAFAIVMLPAAGASQAVYPLNNPAWSLFWELLANAFYAAIWRWLDWRRLAGIIAVSAVCVIVSVIAAGSANIGGTWESLPGGLPRVMFSFFCGVALYRALKGPDAQLSNGASAAILMAAVAVIVFDGGQHVALSDCFSILIVFPAVVGLALVVEPDGAARSWSRRLGAISYPIYVLHIPALFVAREFMKALTAHGIAIPQAVALAAFVASLAYTMELVLRYYDEPVRRWLRDRVAAQSVRCDE